MSTPGFDYQPGFLEPGEADQLLATLWREVPWRAQHIQLFGRQVLQPRLIAWSADPGVRYSYSGLRLEATPWHPAVQALRERLETGLHHRFNSVLLNAYRDGRDSMGWHADDEPELGPQPVIASLSLGEQRRMLVRHARGGRSRGLDLESGSLLLMHGNSQSDYRHAIPKTARAVGLRVNLTFRLVR